MIVNVSVTFKKNDNETEGGYFIISEETGKSSEPFYWPGIYEDNGKNEKLANMELILESDLPVGVSSFSLMRRRDFEDSSYLGKQCNMKYINEELNGRCGDGFFCDREKNGTCQQCEKRQCKNCDRNTKECTECFLISVDGQWNPSGGKGTNLACDLDYIDITKVKINGQKKIEVPPAIHWRVTMDFWIWISDTSVLSEANINMNIVYKDFIAFTLRCFPEGLKIYATPMEWLYEYATSDEDEETQTKYYYDKYMKNSKTEDIIKILKDPVGSYGKVTLEDLVRNATSNWVYVRYGFNLDSSKHYLNDLPESNLLVAQIYTTQTGMPFHMKKFYGLNEMTYLYINNFYHPLTEEQTNAKKNITIYLRNLNIFREYIPQNIITKYYNLHSIDNPKKFPQLLVSFPFSGLVLTAKDTYTMKGYNYYIRKSNGEVDETKIEEKEYKILIDDIPTLRPPRNFWRLNLLELNQQPKTCDFYDMMELPCNSPNEYCFDEEKPFICEEETGGKPYYLDIINLKCKKYCELGYMHPPRYSEYDQRLYCSHHCDSGNKQCPSDELKYTDIYNNFLCTNDFFNLYYKCFSKNEALSNAKFSGIFFSDFLRTPTIYIELSKEYQQFAVDFWYFPDSLLRNKRYVDRGPESPDKEYDPKKHKEPPSEMRRYIFLSDCFKVRYGEDKYAVINAYYNDGRSAFSNSAPIDPIVDNSWNHFVFTYFKKASDSYYTYYLTFTNKHYEYCGHNYYDIYIDYNSYWRGVNNDNIRLSKIIFCSKDENVNVGSSFLKNECKIAQWLDGYYRKLQIFDISYSAKQPIFSSHQFEDDDINGMLKHRYLFGLNSIVSNSLIDDISGADGYIPQLKDFYSKQNPDQTNYLLYQVNYSPEAGIPNWGYQYVNDYTFIKPELLAAPLPCTNKRCSMCQGSTRCIACKEGFSLFSKDCKGDENTIEKPNKYFYKNPGINMPARLSLKMDFNKIINEPYFTIFFFIKIYGFTKEATFDEPVKLLIFHQEMTNEGKMMDDFYLAWDPDIEKKERLSFYVNGQIMFSYPYFREKKFWIMGSYFNHCF
jgi:hypothetical protein